MGQTLLAKPHLPRWVTLRGLIGGQEPRPSRKAAGFHPGNFQNCARAAEALRPERTIQEAQGTYHPTRPGLRMPQSPRVKPRVPGATHRSCLRD